MRYITVQCRKNLRINYCLKGSVLPWPLYFCFSNPSCSDLFFSIVKIGDKGGKAVTRRYPADLYSTHRPRHSHNFLISSQKCTNNKIGLGFLMIQDINLSDIDMDQSKKKGRGGEAEKSKIRMRSIWLAEIFAEPTICLHQSTRGVPCSLNMPPYPQYQESPFSRGKSWQIALLCLLLMPQSFPGLRIF